MNRAAAAAVHAVMRSCALALIASLVLSGCAPSTPSAASPSSTANVTTTPSASPTATHLAVPTGAVGFRIAEGSRAVIRVNEVLANVQLPGEAVVTTTAIDGEFVLMADGTFATGSKIRADLERLKSDSDLRDEWIKINTLQTRIHRFAEFTPQRVSGLPRPLPASGA